MTASNGAAPETDRTVTGCRKDTPGKRPSSRTPAQAQEARRRWAEVIRTTWAKATEAIIETGSQLIAAKDDLPHGEFRELVYNETSFSWTTADRLMAIARHPVLSNSAHAQSLPAHWTTLYELSRLPAKRLLALIKDGTIHPGLERREAEGLVANEIARTTRVNVPAPVPRTLDIAIQRAERPTITTVDFRSSIARPNPRLDASVPTEDVPAELHKLAVQANEIIEPPINRYEVLLAAWKAATSDDRDRFLVSIGARLVAEAER